MWYLLVNIYHEIPIFPFYAKIICIKRLVGVDMDSSFMVQMYPILFLLFLTGILFVIEVFRINNGNGVVIENKWFYMTTIFASLIQLLTLDLTGLNSTYLYVLFGGIFLISIVIKLYTGGKNIKIYDINKVDVLKIIESELDDLSLSYVKSGGLNSEEEMYELEDGVVIKVSENLLGGDITISLRKSWRLPELLEFQYRLIEKLRAEREGKSFWKQSIVQSCLGIGFVIVAIFLFYIM